MSPGGVEHEFKLMKSRIRSTHVHDNNGKDDIHLFPQVAEGGNIDWKRTMDLLRIFDQIFAILGAEERREGRPQARLGFIKQHVREVCGATVSYLEAFDMRKLMGQTGKRGQARICVNSVPRPGVYTKEHHLLHFIETGPRSILYGLRRLQDNWLVATERGPYLHAVGDLLLRQAPLVASCRESHKSAEAPQLFGDAFHAGPQPHTY